MIVSKSILSLSFIALVMSLAIPAKAIQVCHDYTYYRVSGVDPRPIGSPEPQGIGVKTLHDYLTAKGYKAFTFSQAITDPEQAEKKLKPGFILVIRDDHSGFVNAHGRIDYF